MISYRKADLINRVTDQAHKTQRAEAVRNLLDEARRTKSKVYEYSFNDILIDGGSYSGTLSILYGADFQKGSRSTMQDPGEPDSFAIAIENKMIIPGDVYEQILGHDILIWDAKELDHLREMLEAAIPDETIEEAIETKLLQDDPF